MAAFDDLQQAQFEDVVFPFSDISLTGGLRDHVHEYPHSPGGAPEKLGRKLYVVKLTCPMLQGLKKYPNAWPESQDLLRNLWETETTADLVIPTLGTIRAYAISWTEKTSAHNRSGVIVEVEYREDQSSAYLIDQMIDIGQQSVTSAAAALDLAANEEGLGDLFSSIQNAANSIAAIKDGAELYANVIEAKAEGLSRLCSDASDSLNVLQNPARWRVANAVRTLGSAAGKLALDAFKAGIPFQPFVVAGTMSVIDVSRAVFGTTDRAMDIMKWNGIADPLRIPDGTTLRYQQQA